MFFISSYNRSCS